MRVVLIAPEIPDYAMEYARTISGTVEVLLLMPDRYRPSDGWIDREGVAVEWLAWPRQRQILPSITFMRGIVKRIKKWNPDLVHLLMNGQVWTTTFLAMLRPLPVLTTVHDVSLHPGDRSALRVPSLFFDLGVRRSKAIVVHGDSLRRQAIARWRVSPDRCFMFPHVPLNHYREIAAAEGFRRKEDGVFRVLFFGRICLYKGLSYLLSAIEELERGSPPVKLVIAGSGSLEPYRVQIARLASTEVHNDFISARETARLFAEADVLVLPYIEASQSGVLMIAMSFGLPVVATEVGEIAETVARTGTGLLVPLRDPVRLAEALRRLCEDSTMRTTLAGNARSAMQSYYCKNILAQRAQRIYKEVAAMAGPSVPSPAVQQTQPTEDETAFTK